MAVNGGERTGNIAWQVNRAETSMRIGLARLENPTNRGAITSILEASQLPELGLYAKTLVASPASFTEKSLGWALDHARKTDIPVDPNLVAQVEARIRRKG